MHGAVLAALITSRQLRRDLLRDLKSRTLADAEILLYDMIAPIAEIFLSLAADDHKVGFFLIRNMRDRFLEYIGRIRARKSLVRRDDQEKLLLCRVIGF